MARDRETMLGWGAAAIIVVVAVARAATAAPIEEPPSAPESQRREVFVVMASEEATMRRKAAKDFPADAWSQDDAFHNFEYKRAKQIAGERGLRLEDVLLAIDEGMRDKWPAPAGVWLRPTVPPCRPRPIH